MKPKYYVLRGKHVVECDDEVQWAEESKAEWRIASNLRGKVRVTTMFLGRDYSSGAGPPRLFETTVFGGKYDGATQHYAIWEDAEVGHKMMCARVWPKRKGR